MLRAHRNVAEAVVVGSDTIDALVAGVDITGAGLEAWCRRVLGHGHPPVRCFVVDTLPRTPNGKYVRSSQLVCKVDARHRHHGELM